MVNRKLIRPNLAQIKERMAPPRHGGMGGSAVRERELPAGNGAAVPHHRRRPAPPDHTSAEAFYYLKQMNGKTPMVMVLDDGERLTGHIEWYDRNCLKLNRDDAPNLLVFKHTIRYLYKADEDDA